MPKKSTPSRTARKKASPAKVKEVDQRDCVLDCVDILKNLQSGVAILNPDCTILQVNPAFSRITGYPEGELLGRNFKKLIVPATGEDARGFIYAIGDGACRDFKTDWEILRKDKTSLWVRLKLSFTRPEPKAPYRAVITLEDITAKRAAQHLSKNRLYFQQTLMETIPNPVFYKDMNGVFLGCNKAYEKFIGFSRDRIVGKAIRELDEIKFVDMCRKMDEKMFKTPGEQTFETSVRLADGTRREIIFNRAPFFNTDLSLGGLVGIMLDITDLRQTERELKKIQAELEKRVEKRTAKLKASNILLKDEIKERKRIQGKMKARDELLHGILRSVVSQIGVLDVEGNIIVVNEVWQRFGLEEGAPEIKAPGVGENYLDICASGKGGFAGLSKESSAGIKSVLDNEKEQFTLEYPCHLTDKERWFLMFVTPLKGDWGGAVVCHIDITERKAAEIAMGAAEEKYRSIFENAVEGIFQTSPQGKFLSLNPAMANIFGYESPEEMKQSVKDAQGIYVDPRRREEFLRRLHTHGELVNFESQAYRKDGTTIWISENARTVLDEKGKIAFYEGSMEDITLRKRAEEQLLRQAFYDNVTNLPNRALFMDRLGQSIERAKRNEDYRYAVLFLDLDRFKIINDSLGHSLGDHLLTIIANKLKVLLRGLDTVARFGGDEFAILLEGMTAAREATLVAKRIREELRTPISVGGHEIFTSASTGIVLGSEKYNSPEDVLRDADIAMNRAKELGRDRFKVFHDKMHDQAIRLLRMETDLRRALDREEFKLHFQPIVSLESGRLSGFEALLRWQHPERGLVFPADFIPLAEETRLIIPLGEWVLLESCRRLKKWHDKYPEASLTMSVNLSGVQLSQGDLVEQVDRILGQTGVSAGSLKLEITESVLMENAEFATMMLRQLRELNVNLSIDDFGTGYSSLSYLHRFPIDSLKIDRSFITRMSANFDNLEIVQTVISLAHTLGLEVVAEGVETAGQLTLLKELKCEYGQGFYFSKPVASDEASSLLSKASAW